MKHYCIRILITERLGVPLNFAPTRLRGLNLVRIQYKTHPSGDLRTSEDTPCHSPGLTRREPVRDAALFLLLKTQPVVGLGIRKVF